MIQQDLLAGLKERFAIGEALMEDAQNKAFTELIEGKQAVENPQLVIIGGQVGSKKEDIKDLILQEFQGNAVVISLNDLRKYHPHTEAIKTEYPDMMQPLTADFVRSLLTHLENVAIQQKLNVILEMTLSNIDSVAAKINKFKSNQYEIGLSLLSLNKMFSYLNAEETYEKTLLIEKNGNLVSKQHHDQHYEEIAVTLQKLEAKNLLDNVMIYRNELQEKEGKIVCNLTVLERNTSAFVDTYLRERNRDFTDIELVYLKEKALSIKALKANRDAYFLEKIRFDLNVKLLVDDRMGTVKVPKLKNQ
ncbi:MAG: zeta toxin family protein [Arcicella sp.]|nr:zeta toxin family protein [Arcicella sp.]